MENFKSLSALKKANALSVVGQSWALGSHYESVAFGEPNESFSLA